MTDLYAGSHTTKPLSKRELLMYQKQMKQSIQLGEKIQKHSEKYHEQESLAAEKELEDALFSTQQ